MNIKKLKQLAIAQNKTLIFNRSINGYQVCAGFTTSLPEFPFYQNKKPVLSQDQLKKLASYI
jgi:hypothetical protein